MARPSTAPSAPLSEYLRVPHLPLALVLDRLAIARLALAPPVLGESVIATIAGSGEIRRGAARATLDLHRIDGVPGKLALRMSLAGTHPLLSLRLHASEPTGILLDRWLGRTDRRPLTLSLNGRGPVADWHGRLTASAGALAQLDADVVLKVGSATILDLSGKAAVAPLLPADLASPIGGRAGFALRMRLGRRIVVNHLSLDLAAGTLAGDAAFGGPDRAVAAHLRANLPRLALLSGIAGAPLEGAASLNIGVTGSQDHPVVTADLIGNRDRRCRFGGKARRGPCRGEPDRPARRRRHSHRGRGKRPDRGARRRPGRRDGAAARAAHRLVARRHRRRATRRHRGYAGSRPRAAAST